MPAQGRYCKDCERMEHQESYYGVTSDNWSDEDGKTTLTEDDSNE